MAIPHAQPGEVFDVRPLADTLAVSKTRTLIKTPHVEVRRHSAAGDIVLRET